MVFGPHLAVASRLAELLSTDGIERGLLGPGERDRIWDRHLSNCAVVTDLLPTGARVVDVGSGAGLPGLAMACRRPDLRVDLVESLARRVTYLTEVVARLNMGDRIRVFRGRAEAPETVAGVGGTSWVTARAVAPLERLAVWCLPLLRPGGTLLAIKGDQADAELRRDHRAVERAGGVNAEVVSCGAGMLDSLTTVVCIQRAASDGPRSSTGGSGRR